ncbi:transient-receptor-potential-like protein [Anabrus simplex]|uniref:transient-receptor-potential-like protein n=1 Tax=Anabrus simplex TaxID=316456 RepID=UPI0035A3C6F5
MADIKKDHNGVGLEIEAPGIMLGRIQMPDLPKPLTLEEKKYLLAVERGDLANVRRMLQLAHRRRNINMNCLDSLGRGALNLAIDSENLEMVELLVVMGVETKDALLHAINAEFIEAVELLLEHEEIIHKEGEPYSWEKVDCNTATFTPDITPLILAAHKNNYEILKILMDRGATLPMPHDIKCGCEECIRESNEDSLRFSRSRVNQYRALASSSLIALSSNDPILTAFQLSWELRNLAFAEQESKSEYMELRRQCQQFAVDLLHQSRSSTELAIILNHDPTSPPYEEGEHMKLTRLELAIDYKQKKFVAHPNIQQLLAAIWYEGLPGFRRKSNMQKLMEIVSVALLFPFYCTLYMIAPNTSTGKLVRKPFMKFLIHASSYLFFLGILILVSQRAEVQIIQLFGTESMRRNLEEQLRRQRGNGPSPLEWIVVIYVLGFIWEEMMEIYTEGIRSYLRDMWNFIDFTRNMLYVLVGVLRTVAYIQQRMEISYNPTTAYIPREQWDDFDPQLVAEGLFAAANVFSALKLVHMFSINPHLGPLQISLGRMVIDIVKFFFIYSLVLFAFACGLNQLLWYFADLERGKCYHLPGGLPDWENYGDSCMKWRYFGNLFESSQSLFWASFGGVGIDSFELSGIKTYTRFWGLLMFGSYSVINVIVLLNLLIAMMSNSYAMIDEHSDVEWKFARTRLWMSYFEESATLPPPFNIFPTPKHLFKLFGLRKRDKLRRMSSKRKERQEKERDYRYTAVMRSLVWRYVSAIHRAADENPVTEDDINEVKGEISAMKCEMLEVLKRNGMDTSSADHTEKVILGKKMRIWERRLMKDFHLAPVAGEEEMEQMMLTPPENEDSLARFRRIAKLAVLNSTSNKWRQVVNGVCQSSQIGRCNNRESFKNQQNLQMAMQQANKLVSRSPIPGHSPRISPIPLPETTGDSIMELLKDITEVNEEDGDSKNQNNNKPKGSGGGGGGGSALLNVVNTQVSRTPSPMSTMNAKSIQAAKSSQDLKKTQSHQVTKQSTAPGKLAADRRKQEVTATQSQPGSTSISQTASETKRQDLNKSQPAVHQSSANTNVNKPQAGPGCQSQQINDNTHSEPQSLIPPRRPNGESPQKVIRRKAPPPTTKPEDTTKESAPPVLRPEPSQPKDNNAAYPILAGPLQQAQSSTDNKGNQGVNTQSRSSGVPDVKGPKEMKVEPKKISSPKQYTVPNFEVTLANTENSTNASVSLEMGSTDHLIGVEDSPAPLRPIKKIEDVKTIKRQSAGPWI